MTCRDWRSHQPQVEEFKEDVSLDHFQGALADHDDQARETDAARTGICCGVDQAFEGRNGHEPMGNAREPAQTKGSDEGRGQQAQAEAPHAAHSHIAEPDRPAPFLEAAIQKKERSCIQKQMVPGHMHKRVGEGGPPVAVRDTLRHEDQEFRESPGEQWDIDESHDDRKRDELALQTAQPPQTSHRAPSAPVPGQHPSHRLHRSVPLDVRVSGPQPLIKGGLLESGVRSQGV